MTNGIAYAMNGSNPAFSLPPGYGFDDLSQYEEERRKAFANDLRTQLAERRKKLSEALTNQGKQLFDVANPGILEDLNSRGLLTSPTAVSQQQTQALKEIELANQGELNQFDNSATAAGLSADQDALDSALDLRRGSLEQRIQDSQSAREEALARDLAKQQGRNSLYGSLIGVGGQLGSAYLGAKVLGGSGLFGGGGGGGVGGAVGGSGVLGGTAAGTLTGTAYGAPGFQAASSLFPQGLGQVGTATTAPAGGIGLGGGAAILGAGIGSMMVDNYLNKKIDWSGRFGNTGGAAARFMFNPVGSQLNFAKSLVSDPKATAKRALGNAPSQVSNVVSSVGNSISKAFCFEANTPISMDDGSVRPINQLYIGAETLGGTVESIRTSKTDVGTKYLYKGVQVTGEHAVKEGGKWLRVKDSDYSQPLKGDGIVWSIVTDKHRVWVNGIEFADEHESDQWEHLTIDQSLAELNRQEKEVAYGV